MAVAAGEPHRGLAGAVERGHEGLVDTATEDHERGVPGFDVGDAEAADEFTGLAHLREQTCELHTPAMHDSDLVAVAGEISDAPSAAGEQGRVFKSLASELDNELHNSPSAARFIASPPLRASPA